MGINFRTETFRDDFTFRNSPEHIRRFPFPFHEDSYMYAVNIEPHVAGAEGQRAREPDRRRRALRLRDAGPRAGAGRGPAALPVAAAHDAGRLGPARTADDRAGAGLSRAFHAAPATATAGTGSTGRSASTTASPSATSSTLPYGPMEYITRQSQGDFCILDQRDGNLWMDAGMVTTQADWSLDFDIGMNFFEWHAPVPLAHEKGIFTRALKFLTNIQQGKPARRLNWTMTINPRLDTSPENYHKWGPDRADRHAGECRPEGASARRAAELLAPAALQRARLPDPLLPDQDGRAGDVAEMGAAPAPRASATCRTNSPTTRA